MDIYYMWKDTMYTKKPKFTEVDCMQVENGITYYVVKRLNMIPLLLLFVIIALTFGIYYEFANYDEVFHTVNYHTTLYCSNGELQLNIANNADNKMNMVISLYDEQEVLLDHYSLQPGECIGNVQVETIKESGTSGMYTLEFNVYDTFTMKQEKVDVLIVFN